MNPSKSFLWSPSNLRYWSISVLAVGLTAGAWLKGAGVVLALDGTSAAPSTLSFSSSDLPLIAGVGGFSVQDFAAGQDNVLQGGMVAKEGAGFRFKATGRDLKLTALFTPKGDRVVVTGEVETTRSEDRALIVRYTVPLRTGGTKFESTLSHSIALNEQSHELGTIFPIAAMTGPNWGVALAIPPSFPCCFGMLGTARGLSVEFYLGVSPLVRAFPNRAAFNFVIQPAQAGWGFRSALAQYYTDYPEYYLPRIKGSGFWNWNDPAGAEGNDPLADAALPLYKAHGLTMGIAFQRQLAHDEKFGVLSFAYTIVGMREITGLSELPPDYEGGMKVLTEFEKNWREEGPTGPPHKKFPATDRSFNLPEQIRSSTVGNADGHLRLKLRNSVWGANSVTFIENPNPDLFKDQGVSTVGGVTLKLVTDWLTQGSAPGVHLDSLGSQWPSCVNYRSDHFVDARFPLTFDKNGRIALHNMVSHYEFVDAVRMVALKTKKYVFGNGFDIYESRTMDEHYNGRQNGRFFLAALVDAGGREITDDRLSRDRLEAFRTCFGPKLMTAVLYKWTDPDAVAQQMNRALAVDVFAAPNRFFEDKISYLSAQDGFARDKELLNWFSKNARMLHDAGWQPVTHARVNNADVICERYGKGDVIYFTLLNLSSSPVECDLTVDMAALGIALKEGATSTFSEVARRAKITPKTDDDTGHIRVKLEPDQTQIIKLARTW